MLNHAMTRLLKRGLKPYLTQLFVVVLLQAMATFASLELPTLNADIIDNGVAKGDTHYIWVHGATCWASR